MGEKERKPFPLTFNGLLKVDFHGSRVTSDGGLILVRELDERLGLGTPRNASSATFAFKSRENLPLLLIAYPSSAGGIHLKEDRGYGRRRRMKVADQKDSFGALLHRG